MADQPDLNTTQPSNPSAAGTVQEDKVVTIGKYRIKVVRSLCIGAASCVAFSGQTFELDQEKKAVIKPDSTDVPENILMAAQSCPTKAIIIVDTETENQVWPD